MFDTVFVRAQVEDSKSFTEAEDVKELPKMVQRQSTLYEKTTILFNNREMAIIVVVTLMFNMFSKGMGSM